jgi:hypothetical protein
LSFNERLIHKAYIFEQKHLPIPTFKMTDSGGSIKVPNTQEEEQMQQSADSSKAKREAARKAREAREAAEIMKNAAESSKNRRKKN